MNTLFSSTHHYILCLLLCLMPLHLQANTMPDGLFAPKTTTLEQNSPPFLPVDQAYQLAFTEDDHNIHVDWVIAKDYFLYGESLKFHINNQAVTATTPKGMIAFDEVFQKQVEKHYTYVRASINKAALATKASGALTVTYQGCADAGLCYPPQTRTWPLSNPVAPEPTNSSSLWLMIMFAIIGGALLNLMPCVFPVLSIKAIALAGQPQRKARIQHGWSYTLGSMTTFVILAILLLALRQSGQAIGWGFQLQSPVVISLLTFVFFTMGLILLGAYNIGARWMDSGQSLTQGHRLKHSFFTGALAVIVASPCTAPFMATALGFALTQPALTTLIIFAALGAGMALPFLLLSYSPHLAQVLPAPGGWMETFKQAMAFPLFATSLWLLWVLQGQTDSGALLSILFGCLMIALGLWLSQKLPWPRAIGLLTLTLITGIIINQSPQSTKAAENGLWTPYSKANLQQLREQGKAVFVNATANWCVTCKINEKLVLTQTRLQQMQRQGIHLLEADWTNNNPEITQLLARYQRAGVPLYLLFPAQPMSDAYVLPQILTPATMDNWLEKLYAHQP